MLKRLGPAYLALCFAVAASATADAQEANPGLVVQTAHYGDIGSVVSSSDCTLAASIGSIDHAVRIYDTIRNRMITVLGDGQFDANAAVFMKDKTRMVTATNENVRIIGTFDSKVASTFTPPDLGSGGSIQSVALSPDENLIAAGTNTGGVFVWERGSGQLKHSFGMGPRKGDDNGTDILTFVSFAPDGRQVVATGGVGARIGVFDLAGGAARIWDTGHISVESAALSDDGATLAIAGSGAMGTSAPAASVWNLATGKRLGTLKVSDISAKSIRFFGDAGAIYVGSGKTISVFNRKNLKREKQYTLPSTIGAMAKSCGVLLSFDSSGLVYDYNTKTPKQSAFVGAENVMFMPDFLMDDTNGRILIGSTFDNAFSIAFANATTGAIEPVSSGSFKSAMRVEFINSTPDARLLMMSLSGDEDSGAVVNIAADKVAKQVPYPGYAGNAHIFADGENVLVSGYESASIIESLTTDAKTPFPVKSIETATFHPSLPLMAVTSWDEARNPVFSVWDTKGLTKLAEASVGGGSGDEITFTPDGRTVILFSFGAGINRLDIGSGKVDQPYGEFAAVTGAISPDGSVVVAATQDGQFKICDTATGKVLKEWTYSGAYARQVIFAGMDSKIASTHGDGAVRIWSAHDGSLLTTSYLFGNGQWATQTPDGYFATNSAPDKMFAVVAGENVVPPGNLLEAYGKPDMIAQKLASAQPIANAAPPAAVTPATAPAPPPATAQPGIVVSTKPTHVLKESSDVRNTAGQEGQIVQKLDAGTLLNVVAAGDVYSLVAKDGSLVGYVANRALLKLQ